MNEVFFSILQLLTNKFPMYINYWVKRNFYVDLKNAINIFLTVPEGSCQKPENTASGIIGWWNGLSPSWTDIDQCSAAEIPSGIQKATYYYPRNISQPDEVWIGSLLCH